MLWNPRGGRKQLSVALYSFCIKLLDTKTNLAVQNTTSGMLLHLFVYLCICSSVHSGIRIQILAQASQAEPISFSRLCLISSLPDQD